MQEESRPSSQPLPTNCVYYVEESGSSLLERDIAVSVIVSLSSEWEVPSSFAVLGRQRKSLQLKSPTKLSCYGAIHYVKKETNTFDPLTKMSLERGHTFYH